MRRIVVSSLLVFLLGTQVFANETMYILTQRCTANPTPVTGSGDLTGTWISTDTKCGYQNDLKARASKYGNVYQVQCESGYSEMDVTYNLGAACSCDKYYENYTFVTVGPAPGCALLNSPAENNFVYVAYSTC